MSSVAGFVPRSERADEALFDARDAYRSAKTLAALVFAATLIASVSVRAEAAAYAAVAPAPWIAVAVALLAASGGSFAWLVSTRRAPRSAPAVLLCCALLGALIPILAFAAEATRAAGRPFEALVAPKLAMLCVALVVPRYFWIGVAFVVAFALEALAIDVALVRAGVHGLTRGEPGISLFCGAAGLALLTVRQKRREIARRYLRAESEAAMLRRAEGQLQALCAELARPFEVLAREIARLRQASPSDARISRMERSTHRLQSLSERLGRLEPGVAIDPAAASPPPSTPAGGLEAALSARERRFHAEDMHASATTLAMVVTAGGVVAALVGRGAALGWAPLFSGMQSLAGLVSLALLVRTRDRPSEGRALALFLVQIVPALLVRAYGQTQFAHAAAPYEPFLGHKIAMALLPVVLPRRLWLGVAIEAALLLEALWLYVGLDLAAQKHRIPSVEPWWTLLYAAIGFGMMAMREQRRIASVRLLRDEMEISILTRRASLSLSILDQIGSPLQSITLGVAALRSRETDPGAVAAIDEAVRAITSIVRASTELAPRGDAAAA